MEQIYYNSEFLSHYGVPGMKWGVRRYRNADGSLTAAGKKRQDESDKKYREKQKIKTAKYYNKTRIENFERVEGIKSLQRKLDSESGRYDKNVIRGKLKAQEALKKQELKKVSALTHDQIQKERTEVGKAVAKDFLVSLGATAVLLPTSGFVYVQTPNAQAVRSRTRMGS